MESCAGRRRGNLKYLPSLLTRLPPCEAMRGLALLCTLTQAAALASFRPPAIPLLTTDPFTQTWMRGDTSTSAQVKLPKIGGPRVTAARGACGGKLKPRTRRWNCAGCARAATAVRAQGVGTCLAVRP